MFCKKNKFKCRKNHFENYEHLWKEIKFKKYLNS